MDSLPYAAGFWFGEKVVLPFMHGMLDAVMPDVDAKVISQVQQDISDAIPDWMKRYF